MTFDYTPQPEKLTRWQRFAMFLGLARRNAIESQQREAAERNRAFREAQKRRRESQR